MLFGPHDLDAETRRWQPLAPAAQNTLKALWVRAVA